jgi:hypothetical protein
LVADIMIMQQTGRKGNSECGTENFKPTVPLTEVAGLFYHEIKKIITEK